MNAVLSLVMWRQYPGGPCLEGGALFWQHVSFDQDAMLISPSLGTASAEVRGRHAHSSESFVVLSATMEWLHYVELRVVSLHLHRLLSQHRSRSGNAHPLLSPHAALEKRVT